MKVAITGSTGLIGSALVPRLRAEGHQVIRIVRRAAGDDEVRWNPTSGTIDGPESVIVGGPLTTNS
jgi:uncharacterized protein YbjT (DUF2867 family)